MVVSAKSYTVGPVEITAVLDKNGDMRVDEQRVFKFNESYTFAYQKIPIAAKQDIYSGRSEKYDLLNIKLCDEFVCYRQLSAKEQANADEARPINTFYTRREGDDLLIKWFYRQTDGSRTFTLSYTVPKAVTLHTDAAELYRQWIGDK